MVGSLSLILLGATLLVFYGLPTQQFSNVIVIGDQVVSWDGPGGPVSAESIDEIRRFQRGPGRSIVSGSACSLLARCFR
jgi:hypothetical protein